MINPDKPDFANTPISSKRPKFNYSPVDPLASPVLSIVTPFFNTNEIFHQTAQSVLQQSLQQWEWLIVNDGSNDLNSINILKKYRDKDPRIRVIDRPENRGPSVARNIGFREAKTPFILQIDSDDLLESTASEKWLWFLETNPDSSFVMGHSVGFGYDKYLWNRGFHDGRALLRENVIQPTALIRKSVHELTGGYDENNRNGLEDWEFWLRCASYGYWGDTVPEYLSWYRRRPSHTDRWSNWDRSDQQAIFLKGLRQKYPNLWKRGFPKIRKKWHMPYQPVPIAMPFTNLLKKNKRILMIVPWLTIGGADKFNLDLIGQLHERGWEATIAATLPGDNTWEYEFSQFTPDIFILNHFLRLVDYPIFLRYLIESRQPDVVMVSNSELGYLVLPYLRAYCPKPVYTDFCHMEEEFWKNGGFPRKSLVYQPQLDLNIVASNHLKKWEVNNGGEEDRIDVCYINVDTTKWKPDSTQRDKIRYKLGLSKKVPILLFVGRLTPQKRPILLARVIQRLVEKRYDFVSCIVGDGPDRKELEHFINQYKLAARVRVLGALPSKKVCQLMQASDIFFLPSSYEGIALTLYEAMSCGLPVVGTEVGGQNELVHPDCGILIQHGPNIDESAEIENYAQAIGELLQNPQRMKRLGRTGRKHVKEKYRIEQMGDRVISLFRKASHQQKVRPRQPVPIAIGNIIVQEAIESLRLFYLAEQLWQEREKWERLPIRLRLYVKLRELLLPLYIRTGGDNWELVRNSKQFLRKMMGL